jgi:hypothetical protein
MGYKKEFVKELGGYGLTNERIDRVLDVLRIVYIVPLAGKQLFTQKRK